MKACIVEIRGNHAAALTEDGSFIKIRNRHYVVGQKIERERESLPVRIVSAAAACAAMILLLSIAQVYFTPYTYVSLDVNPSIEYSVNQFNLVLGAKAVDSDAAKVLNGLHLNNKTIDDAIDETVNKIRAEGYFKSNDPGGIIISTSCDDAQSAAQLADQLKLSALKSSGSGVEVEAINVDRSKIKEAKELGTTPGKLNLVQKLQSSTQNSQNINVKEWLNKPVKDIIKAIDANDQTGSTSPSETNGTASAPETNNGSQSNSNLPQASSELHSETKQSSADSQAKDDQAYGDISESFNIPRNSWGTSHEAADMEGKNKRFQASHNNSVSSLPESSDKSSHSTARAKSAHPSKYHFHWPD